MSKDWVSRVNLGANQGQKAQSLSQRSPQRNQPVQQDTNKILASEISHRTFEIRFYSVSIAAVISFSVSRLRTITVKWDDRRYRARDLAALRDWEQLKCSLFDQFGDCRFGTACRCSHNKPQLSSADSNNKANIFADKALGSIQSVCNRFPDCSFGDRCVFRHPGRELNQQSEANALEQEKAQKSELDNFRGIPIKKEKGVRFNQ